MRLRLTLAYEGTAYCGWQIQEKANPPPTVQGAVETALFALVGQKIRVFGAGRTDTGVHALGQVAHCDLPERSWDWRHRLNSVLPPDIRILSALPAAPDFHARRDALTKTYRYQFWQEKEFVAPLLRNQVWPCGPLDCELAASGLGRLLGEHDFASFQNSGTSVKSTVRTITGISLREIPQPDYGVAPMLCLEITGSGFLKQMVRNIAGFLAETGRKRVAWGCLESVLASRNRTCLPAPTAPAKGLFLAGVNYEHGK